jgi:hypothetical protein
MAWAYGNNSKSEFTGNLVWKKGKVVPVLNLGGPQSRSGRREEKILDPTGTRTPIPRSSSPYPVAIPSTLIWKPIRKRQLKKPRKQRIILRWILGKKVLWIGNIIDLVSNEDRATAQAVSRRLPTAAARVRAQVRSCGISGRQSGAGAGFLRVFRFPLPIPIPPTASHTSSIIWGWYNRSKSGRRAKWPQSYPTPTNQKQEKTNITKRALLLAVLNLKS